MKFEGCFYITRFSLQQDPRAFFRESHAKTKARPKKIAGLTMDGGQERALLQFKSSVFRGFIGESKKWAFGTPGASCSGIPANNEEEML